MTTFEVRIGAITNTPPHRFLPALGVFLLVACGSDSTAPAGPLTVTPSTPRAAR